jgi:chemotaxis protein methyltransferase CheR
LKEAKASDQRFKPLKQCLALRRQIPTRKPSSSYRSSSGQEAYSLAMLLHDQLGNSGWEIFGSDINNTVLSVARNALYPIKLAEEIPPDYLKKYCLKGVGQQEGMFKIDPLLINKIRFDNINLNENLPDIGIFDVIFLCNVLIYSQPDTKRAVVARLLSKLKRSGQLHLNFI